MVGITRTIGYQYDATGNRTYVTHPDGVSFRTDYDAFSRATNQSWLIGASVTPFMGISYDSAGRRSTITRGLSYTDSGYDGISRMTSLTQRFAGSIGNVTQAMTQA